VAEVTRNSVKITWTDNANNETGFRIERRTESGSFTQIATVNANTTVYTNTGLTNNTNYRYRVRAYNAAGDSAASNEVSITTGDTPAAPSNLVAVLATGDSALLSWSDNSNNESGFMLERRTGSGSYTQIATLTANTNSYINTGLSPNTTYRYRIRAYNSSGESAWSNEANVTTGSTPAAPTDLRITATTGSSVSLIWTDNASNESGYKIERRTGSGNYVQVATTGANATSYVASGLAANTFYQFRVRAYNSAGDSSYSNEVSTVTSQIETRITLTVGKTAYTVNNQQRTMDASPLITEGRTLLPFRYVAEAIGARVQWDAATQKVTVTLDSKVIELWIGKPTARVNGVEKAIDANNRNVTPIVIPPGRTMLPLRFIAENLGCSVEWDAKTQQVKIVFPAAP